MNSGKGKKPGAFSLTWIEVRSDAEGVEENNGHKAYWKNSRKRLGSSALC
jgi:hypothetical protein